MLLVVGRRPARATTRTISAGSGSAELREPLDRDPLERRLVGRELRVGDRPVQDDLRDPLLAVRGRGPHERLDRVERAVRREARQEDALDAARVAARLGARCLEPGHLGAHGGTRGGRCPVLPD
ncbi:hypothetical protein DLJ96_19400, partial [Actinotalea fermentans ATCC 43279 = JCM 9966 = DSM 3133]